MRFSTLLGAALALGVAAPAFAQDTAPPPPLTVSGSVAVLSDYRLRGVSQTDKHATVQGSLTIAHESGFYIGAFGANLAGWGTFGGANLELDGIVGYKHSFTTGPISGGTIDAGLTWYNYPGGADKTDFAELFARLSGTHGPATLTAGVYYAPNQDALGLYSVAAGVPRAKPVKWDNLYVTGDLAVAIPKTPVTAKAHIGASKGNPGLGPNGTSVSPTGHYVDYSVGADVAFHKNLTFNIAYVDTDISEAKAAYLRPNFAKSTDGSSISSGKVVIGLTASF